MNSQPLLISIVLPVRNGALYLEETLKSLLAQTYTHFELLVLENDSSDETPAILKRVSDGRIKVFSSAESLSIEANWQRILDLQLQDWITIISHDDRWHPDFLYKMVELIRSEPNASLYTAHFSLIDAAGETIRRAKSIPYRESGDSFLERKHLWEADSFGTGYLMRTDDYRKVGGIPSFPGLFYADDVLWAKLSNIEGKVCTPKLLYDYRYYRSSNARTIDLLGLYAASNAYLDYVQTRPYFQEGDRWQTVIRYVERQINRNYQRFLVNLVTKKSPTQLRQYRQTKAELLHLAAQDQRFGVYNPILSMIEAVEFLPTESIRVLALQLMEESAKWMRRFTD